MASNEISIAIHTEQLRAVFRQLPISFAVNLVNAALTAIVLSTIGTQPAPLVWFSLVALVTGVRWVLWRQYRRSPPGSEQRPYLVEARCLRIIACRIMLGLWWNVAVPDCSHSRADLSHICHRRDVRRHSRIECIAFADPSRLSAIRKPADGGPLLRRRHYCRQRARGDDRCLCCQHFRWPERTSTGSSPTQYGCASSSTRQIFACRLKWPNTGQPRLLCARLKSSRQWVN